MILTVTVLRSFGRFTLVGSHTINSIHRFLSSPGPGQPSRPRGQARAASQGAPGAAAGGRGQRNFAEHNAKSAL